MATLAPALVLLALLPGLSLHAQENAPEPAVQLQKLAPFLGNWSGSGTAHFGPDAPPTKWEAQVTFSSCLDGFFVQEDFRMAFEGVPNPYVSRSIHGFDNERQSFVVARVDNRGTARFDKTAVSTDGVLVHFMDHMQLGLPYAERQRRHVEEGKLHLTIDLLMSDGPSMCFLNGVLSRAETPGAFSFATATFLGETPAAPMKKLLRIAGIYELTGSIVVAPGVPPLKISGTETFESAFGGTVLYGHSDGQAEGMPGAYHAEVFWAYDADRACFVNVFASNMGEIGTMESRFSADGKSLISTAAGTRRGQPSAQRYLLHLDAAGSAVSGSSHSIVGSDAPAETFTATYKRK